MKKKVKFVIVILILILLILIIKSTYSKYVEQANGNLNNKIGQWIIKVNSVDITQNELSTEFNIDNFIWDWENAPHVKKPKVAPGMKGSFDLIIDPTDTDVSLEYTISVAEPKINQDDPDSPEISLKIVDIKEKNNKDITLTKDDNGNNIIKRVKSLSEIQSENDKERLDEITVTVEWENNEDNNAIDSEIGSVFNNKISMPVSVDVIQYTGL